MFAVRVRVVVALLPGLLTVALSAAAQPVLPLPPPPPPRPASQPPPGWTGSIGGGFAVTSGNSDTATLNVGFDVLKDHGTNVTFKATGLYLSGSTGGTPNVDRSQADARFDYRLSERLSAFALGTFARDRFKAIEYLAAPTTGLSYKLVNTDRTQWQSDGSVGVVFEKNQGRSMATSGALLAGEKFTHNFTDATRLTHAASALWKVQDFEDGFYTFSLGLLTSVARHLDLKTEFLSTYKNQLTDARLRKADQSVVLSVVYKY